MQRDFQFIIDILLYNYSKRLLKILFAIFWCKCKVQYVNVCKN